MKKLKILFFFSLLVQAAFAQGTLTDGTSLKLQEVTFAPDNDNFFPVRRDIDTNFYVPQGQPHWRIDYHDSIPIAYQSGTYAKVSSARFKITCLNVASRASIRIRGKAIDERGNVIFVIPETTAQIANQGQDTFAIISNKRADRRFGKDTIKYFNRLRTTWEFSLDRRSAWVNVEGQSSNEAYVVWRKPVPEIGRGYGWGYKRHHSLFHIVCSAFHNHFISDSSAMINKVWSLFDRQYWIQDSINPRLYRKVDGLRLAYYRNYTDPATTTEELLKFGTGQCTSFSWLFRDLLRLQGSSNYDDRNSCSITPADSIQLCTRNRRMYRYPYIKFLVKNWRLGGDRDTTYSPYATCTYNTMPYFMVVATNGNPTTMPTLGGTDSNGQSYYLIYTSTDSLGISGQNSKNPESYFNYHMIVKINNIYYDPSYGVIYHSPNDFLQYISGWIYLDVPANSHQRESQTRRDLNKNGRIDDDSVWNLYNIYNVGNERVFPFKFDQ